MKNPRMLIFFALIRSCLLLAQTRYVSPLIIVVQCGGTSPFSRKGPSTQISNYSGVCSYDLLCIPTLYVCMYMYMYIVHVKTQQVYLLYMLVNSNCCINPYINVQDYTNERLHAVRIKTLSPGTVKFEVCGCEYCYIPILSPRHKYIYTI